MSYFVPNFVGYISAKYYLNWFAVGEVIAKIKRVNFFPRRSVDAFVSVAQHNIWPTKLTTITLFDLKDGRPTRSRKTQERRDKTFFCIPPIRELLGMGRFYVSLLFLGHWSLE